MLLSEGNNTVMCAVLWLHGDEPITEAFWRRGFTDKSEERGLNYWMACWNGFSRISDPAFKVLKAKAVTVKKHQMKPY